MKEHNLYKIISSSPNLIQIEICDIVEFKKHENQDLLVGSYLKISDDNDYTILAIVTSYKIKDSITKDTEKENDANPAKFVLDVQPIGSFYKGVFIRGGSYISIPPTKVEIADKAELKSIYVVDEAEHFTFSHLSQDSSIPVTLNGNNFFSKHIAVVGSTGSGKSCTVAKILHEATNPSPNQKKSGILNNSHVIIFDIHGEYASSFKNAKVIKIEDMVLPYWLMNSSELEEIFIESKENNAYNQSSIFKKVVTKNKENKNTLDKIKYDSPVYFNLVEVLNYIKNLNSLTVYPKDNKKYLATLDDELEYNEDNLWKPVKFEESTGNSKHDIFNEKVSKFGGFDGDLDRFISRLETKINDKRLAFIMNPVKKNGKEFTTEDLSLILRNFVSYIDSNESNITILDLSGIPFEILNIVVSLVSRLLFDFGFYYKKIQNKKDEVPLLLVYEEAHKYIPRAAITKSSVTNTVERVAKEGRKYGVSLMIVSQRPSEISETVFSQCNNFVAMRLTNPADQQYVQKLLPDNMDYMINTLPTLKQREAIIVGDSISLPSIVKIDELEFKPNSNDIAYYKEWNKDWVKFDFDKLTNDLITSK